MTVKCRYYDSHNFAHDSHRIPWGGGRSRSELKSVHVLIELAPAQ